jgi:hypothetical protein
MEHKSEQYLRKRKFLLMLPVLMLPFLAMVFWALGGGKGAPGEAKPVTGGINTSLPGASFKGDKPKDKLALYELSRRDSVAEKVKTSPLFNGMALDTAKVLGAKALAGSSSVDANEAKINEKLAEIRKAVRAPEKEKGPVLAARSSEDDSDPETDKLKALMQEMQNNKAAPDPELKQLEGMMDKILLIQHPERADSSVKKPGVVVPDSLYKAIRAVIPDKQKVVQGASVKLELVDSVKVHGIYLPKGQLLFGLCQVTNQRLFLHITHVRLGTLIVPVDLTVYDLDGMEGIRASDAVTQDAMRSGSDNAIQSLRFMSMDPGLASQAAGAGVEAAKTLFSKKVRRVKVKLKAGYPVLIITHDH